MKENSDLSIKFSLILKKNCKLFVFVILCYISNWADNVHNGLEDCELNCAAR